MKSKDMLKRIVFLGAVFLGTLSPGQAAPAGPAPVVSAKVSFLLVANAKPVEGAFLEIAKKGPLPVALTNAAKSPVYPYEGPESLSLWAPDKGAPNGRRELVKVPISGMKQPLLLLAPESVAKDAPPRYRAVAVEDDWQTVPEGTLRFINFSGKKLMVSVGGKVTELGNGPSAAIRIAEAGKDSAETDVQIASFEANSFELAFQLKAKVSKTQRQTILVFPPAKQGGLGVKVVTTRESKPMDQVKPVAPPR